VSSLANIPLSVLVLGNSLPATLGLVLLIGAAALFSLLLRAARVPGGRPAAIVAGGIVAGLLLGPAGLPGVWPQQARTVFTGGVQERADLLAMESRHRTEIAALAESNVSQVAIDEQRARHADEIEPLIGAWEEAKRAHAQVMGAGAVTLSALALLLTGLLSARSSPRRRDGRAAIAGAAITACAMFILAAVPTALLLMWIMNAPALEAIAIGGCAGGGSLFAGVPMRWVGRDARRATIKTAALTVCAMAGAVISIALEPGSAWVVIAPAAALGAGALLGLWSPPRRRRAPRLERLLLRGVIFWLLLPGITAYAMHTVDPRILLDGWGPAVLAIIALLTAGGGQFIGAWLALQTIAPERVRAKAHFAGAEILALGVGPTQGLLLALLIAGGAIDPTDRALAAGVMMVLVSAVAIECGVTVNRVAVSKLDDEIEEAER